VNGLEFINQASARDLRDFPLIEFLNHGELLREVSIRPLFQEGPGHARKLGRIKAGDATVRVLELAVKRLLLGPIGKTIADANSG